MHKHFCSRRLIKIFVILAILFVVYPYSAHAFSVSPLKYVTTLDSGESKSLEITVGNDEASVRNFKILVDSLAITDNGKIFFNKDFSPAENWVTAVPNSFRLNPGQTRNVEIKFQVPENQPPGSHSLAVIVRSETEKNQTVGLAGQSAIPVLLTVAGEVKEELLISEWRPNYKLFTDKQFNFSLLLSNQGNVNVGAAAELRVKDIFGRQKYSETIKIGSEIFANSKRKLAVASSQNIWPGIYRADLLVQYGVLGTRLKATTLFLFLPVWFISLIAVLLIGIIYFVSVRINRKKYEGPRI